MQDRMLEMKQTLKYSSVIMLCLLLFSVAFIDICKAEENVEVKESEEQVYFEKLKESDTEYDQIKLMDIEIEGYQEELFVGDTMHLTATVVPNNATETLVTYKSSDDNVATVKSTGVVEGKKAGKVTIYVSCGEITKELTVNVKIKTKAIVVNSEYVVMQNGQEFSIETKVVPDTADKNITYKSLDENVVEVSKTGVISAKESGITSVVVSNGYSQVAITVVVNKLDISDNSSDETAFDEVNTEVYPTIIDSSNYKMISKEMLQYYYNNSVAFQIKGKDYVISIDGKDIINCENELNTSINLEYTSDDIRFELENKLCGKMQLDLSKIITNQKYLYLFNNDKSKYERLDVDDINNITIDTEGKYLITTEKLSVDGINIGYIIVGICILMMITVGYILFKRKYWFW